MRSSTILAAAAAALASSASAITVSYDPGYDDKNRALTAVSCSDGANGLITRYGWKIQNDIPHFPLIGGASAVSGYNSPQCGTCWKLSYNGVSVNILAIDTTAAGFNIGLTAFNALTNGQGEQLGRIDVAFEQVGTDQCGL